MRTFELSLKKTFDELRPATAEVGKCLDRLINDEIVQAFTWTNFRGIRFAAEYAARQLGFEDLDGWMRHSYMTAAFLADVHIIARYGGGEYATRLEWLTALACAAARAVTEHAKARRLRRGLPLRSDDYYKKLEERIFWQIVNKASQKCL